MASPDGELSLEDTVPLSDVMPRGLTASTVEVIGGLGNSRVPPGPRIAAYARFRELAEAGAPAGRFWKHDYAKLQLDDVPLIAVENGRSDVAMIFNETQVDGFVHTFAGLVLREEVELSDAAKQAGITIAPIAGIPSEARASFDAALGAAGDATSDIFGALARAFETGGTFISVPDGVSLDAPLVIANDMLGGAAFPFTLISIGKGSQVTIVEDIVGNQPLGGGIVEIVVHDRARLQYVVVQRTEESSRLFVNRRALVREGATLEVSLAELGGSLSYSRLRVALAGKGASVTTNALFFASGDQHVDLATEAVHQVGNTTSDTAIRTVGAGRGQGRYVGNIAIDKHAHGSNASLRDDALLLSKAAHIDSVPALEIAANDVKAYHGATIGAIDEDALFYAETRGITRADAERMIALGFFEPVIARFPFAELRGYVRRSLEKKLDGGNAPT